jgi:hypothetical protein
MEDDIRSGIPDIRKAETISRGKADLRGEGDGEFGRLTAW